jgi:hypothetical protein
MIRNDTMNFWNSAAQFPLGGSASEVAVSFPVWRYMASRYNSATVSSIITLTGMSKRND